ncbi:MAG: hypothetical protein A3E23_10415 [Burkholderiales bacterium RIFCSPHIGHO2_12_FULL_65_48]|nr:MAG: hypothetical protein A3E23_10415 [Burkholderiales bacterium RIFCSPHIGHO2_12_FULL_65_48]OGB58225.1 MAG: hypothetical protein A3F71_18465 [Burkholderiales bacterium RIFCSPLOWO2_12_FULL_64_33]
MLICLGFGLIKFKPLARYFGAAFCAYVAIGIQFVAPIVYRGTTVGYTTYAGSLFAMLVGLLIWWPESWIAEK